MSFDTNAMLRWALPGVVTVVAVLGVFAILDQMETDGRAAERRALAARGAELAAGAMRPGSPLACLDELAGEAAGTACEAAVFASPQSTAAAVTYTSTRLTLLADARRFDPAAVESFAAARRAIELDRFGIAAHVLAVRDGCTASACPAFAWLDNVGALQGNMKAQAFDQYVSRHADAWNRPVKAPAAAPPAVSQTEPAPAANTASAEPKSGELVAHPLSAKYDFPSADSIPAVSIMNKEPPLPKAATDAQAAQPAGDSEPKAVAGKTVPVPPKRPQAQSQQADPPPAR